MTVCASATCCIVTGKFSVIPPAEASDAQCPVQQPPWSRLINSTDNLTAV